MKRFEICGMPVSCSPAERAILAKPDVWRRVAQFAAWTRAQLDDIAADDSRRCQEEESYSTVGLDPDREHVQALWDSVLRDEFKNL